MAHKIIAADLGSATLKLARFDATFRKVTLLDVRTLPGAPEGKAEDRIIAQLVQLRRVMAEEAYHAEEIAVGLPGDLLTFRVVDLPFANPRQIEQTIGYELESLILTPVEELVVDFVVLGPVRHPTGEPGGPQETRVLAACAPRVLIERVIKVAQEQQLPLRTVGASPLAYAAALGGRAATVATVAMPEAASTEGAGAAAAGTVAQGADEASSLRSVLVVDVGGESTTVCVLRGGKAELARTIARGGRHVTDSIAAAFKLEPARAEQAKREVGFVAHAGTPRLPSSQAQVEAAVREALAPLVRELRQTIAAYRASYGDDVEHLYLTGGGARLAGLCEHLGEELALPSEKLPFPAREGLSAETAGDDADLLAVVLGLGLSTVTAGTQVNFRKGEYAYRSDYSFLRDKARYFAVAASLVLLFAGIDSFVDWRGLNREHDILSARLKRATVELFGKERDDARSISEELRSGPKGVGQLPIPSATAFDLVDEISRAVPPRDKIKLDILDLDIRPKKTSIKATTETAQQVDDFAEALKKIECFDDVQKGKLAAITVSPPPAPPDSPDKPRDDRPTELKQFTITIKTSCP